MVRGGTPSRQASRPVRPRDGRHLGARGPGRDWRSKCARRPCCARHHGHGLRSRRGRQSGGSRYCGPGRCYGRGGHRGAGRHCGREPTTRTGPCRRRPRALPPGRPVSAWPRCPVRGPGGLTDHRYRVADHGCGPCSGRLPRPGEARTAVHRTNVHRTSLGPGRRRPSGSRRRRPVSCPARPSGGDECPARARLREGRLREGRLLPGVVHRRHRRPSVARSRPGCPGGHRYRPRAAPAGSPTGSWVCRGTHRPHWYGSRPGARRSHRLSVILLPGAPRAAVRHPRARPGRDVLPATGRPFALRPRPDRGWADFLNSCRPDASPSHANPPDEALAAASHPRTGPGAHDGPPGRWCRPARWCRPDGPGRYHPTRVSRGRTLPNLPWS